MLSNRTAVLAVTWMVGLVGCATTKEAPVKVRMEVMGYVAPGFEEVREEFARNFTQRGELGGAFAAYHNGVKVVDLWGGYRTPKRDLPWVEDTSVVVFSATKGVAAMTLAHLHSRGLLDYDEKVSTYWPEFAQKGKGAITVRQLLSHQAGLVLLSREPVATDLEGAAQAIAESEPMWTPGDFHGYHAGTIGFAMQALVTRVDPKHRSLNQYLQEEIAGPLDADFTIGLPAQGYDRSRVAVLKPFSAAGAIWHIHEMPLGLAQVIFNPRSLFWKSMGGNKVDVNSPAYTEGENASGNGVGTARGMARLYGELAAGGANLNLRSQTLQQVFGEAETPRKSRLDKVMNVQAYYGLGFQKPNPADRWFAPSPRAVGFLGASGALGFADPDARLGVAYVTNRMAPGNQIKDPREVGPQQALYRCLARQGML